MIFNAKRIYKKIIIHPHVGGFFSQLNKVIGYICWAQKKGHICSVLWDKTNSDFVYGDPEKDGNLWLCFFEPLPFKEKEGREYEEIEVTSYWGDEGKIKPEELFPFTVPTYRMASLSLYRRIKLHRIYKEYIKILPYILERADFFYNMHINRNFCVGMLIRHPFQGENENIPLVSDFIAKIHSLFPAKIPKIFVVTDVKDAIPMLRGEFGDLVIAQEDILRQGDRLCVGKKYKEIIKEHTMVKPNKKLGEDILSEALILSRCNLFIHPTSNIATAVSYMNPGLKTVFLQSNSKANYHKGIGEKTDANKIF